MSDLQRQVLLSLIDKVLLGGAALIVGYFVNLRLERFRARRALEAEFLRERTRRLDELYVAMLEAEATGRIYVGLEMDRIETNKTKTGDLLPQNSATVDAGARFSTASDTLARKAVHYRPWIGDRLYEGCAEYGKVVENNVTEQTIPGSHDIDRIGQLDARTSELQIEIMAAIREGAPPSAITGTDKEVAPPHPLVLVPRRTHKRHDP